MEPVRAEADLDRVRRYAAAWAVFCAWVEGGQIKALSDGQPRPLSALPGDPRALRITAAILGHLGLLVRSDGPSGELWSLSHVARELNHANALHAGMASQADLAKLGLVLAEGGPVPGPDGVRRPHIGGIRPHDREASRQFLDMLHRRSGPAADETARVVAAAVAPSLREGGRALDLGGGHGRYGVALASRGFKVTLFDQPMVVEIARERNADLLQYKAGDFDTDAFGPEAAGGLYDVVLASNIVHSLGPDSVSRLIHKLRAVVRPGGVLALKDMFIDDTGVGPEPGAMFGLTMLMHTSEGRSYSTSEIGVWLEQAGFKSREHVAMVDQGYALLIAR